MITIALALNPAKLVDRISKVLTPVLFIVISALAIKSILTQIGTIGQAKEAYITHPFFRSCVAGYLTMDVITALVFVIVFVNDVNVERVNKQGPVVTARMLAGVVAAT